MAAPPAPFQLDTFLTSHSLSIPAFPPKPPTTDVHDGFSPSQPVPFPVVPPKITCRFPPLPLSTATRYHPTVSAETTARYLPTSDHTRSQRATVLGSPPFPPNRQTFPHGLENSDHSFHRDLIGLASSTTLPIYSRYRPPHFRAFRIHPLRAIYALPDTLPEPSHCLYLRGIVRSLGKYRPFHRLPGDTTNSGTATASLTTHLGNADHPTQLFSSPHLPDQNHQWPFSLFRRHNDG